MIIIRTARIPIIKMETSTRVVADISLGDVSGPKAANYIAQQVGNKQQHQQQEKGGSSRRSMPAAAAMRQLKVAAAGVIIAVAFNS